MIMAVIVMQAANNSNIRICDRPDRFSFRDTGLSDRTVKVLLACGIDAPKRLLSMTPAEIAIISGVGKISLGEIMRYRARFITTDGVMLNWLTTPTCRLIHDGAARRPAV